MSGFAGFASGACAWFAELSANNSKSWFQANRAFYDTGVHAPMAALMDTAQAQHGGAVKLFRQHRDVRFSKDKSPYKTDLRAGIYGRPGKLMGLYCALDAEGFFAGAGVYALTRDQLANYRAAVIADAGEALAEIAARLVSDGLELSGECLKRVPPGFDKDHPRSEFLKRKNLIAGCRIDASRAEDGQGPLTHAMATWEKLAPLSDWVDTHIVPSAKAPRR